MGLGARVTAFSPCELQSLHVTHNPVINILSLDFPSNGKKKEKFTFALWLGVRHCDD